MEFCVDANQLRAALQEIERAERNGFHHCLAVFKFAAAGPMLDHNRAEYSDLFEKAHPTAGHLNWGRYQGVTRRHRFINGELVKLEDTSVCKGDLE